MECPHCGSQLDLFTQIYEIPYFGSVFQLTLTCGCGYRFVDMYPFEEKEPARFTLPVTREELTARVVKSSTCVITLPELGVRVDPGPASEGVVTNVEGILRRVEAVLKTAIRWGNSDQKKEGKKILKNLRKVFTGEEKVTLILEDIRGSSCIVSENAQRELL